eukprot:jgi/Picsp_1/6233/NSC_03587-R1_-binding domain protein
MPHPNIILSTGGAAQIARQAKTVAVLGIKTIEQANQPSYFVPEYVQAYGIRVIPVPVYYPEVTEILGVQVKRQLSAIEEPVDILNVFRPSVKLEGHLDDILSMNPSPGCVWLQTGIRDSAFEMKLANSGIKVVVDQCLKIVLQQEMY